MFVHVQCMFTTSGNFHSQFHSLHTFYKWHKKLAKWFSMLNKNYKHLQIYLSFSPNSTLEIKMKESDIKRLIQLLIKAAHVRI